MLRIQEITNKTTWEKFIEDVAHNFPPFFQTWNWGEVQKQQGKIIWRLGLYENTILLGIVSVTLVNAKRGTYLHLRHGPVLKEYKKEYIDFIMQFLAEKGKARKVSFIRSSPLIDEQKGETLFPFPKFRNAQIHAMDAEVCWVLPLKQSEEEILSGMRKSHRYLIKKSFLSDIKIERTKNVTKFKEFLPLYTKLAHRKHFVAHSGIKEELEIFTKDNQAELFLAYFDKKVIAGALIDFVNGMAIYRHSASDATYMHMPAMYLLQWEVIKEAKKRSLTYYNFWGIAPNENRRHPWRGLTLFKTGFGGEKKAFMHAKDLPLSLWYWKTYAIDMLTKLKKGY